MSLPGGEPLLHPQIGEIVAGLVERKKYVYLCTNALLLEEKLDLFEPTRYLSFSVHLDGLEAEHDAAVCREGTWRTARRAHRGGPRPRLPRHDELDASSRAPTPSGCAPSSTTRWPSASRA